MKLKGIISMFLLMLYAMGSIGGFGYAMYCKAYVIAAAVLIVAAMAFPTIRKAFKEWTE
jgi:hypothetical protein